VSLNLAHAFVRYPDVAGAASTAAGYLAAEAKERGPAPRTLIVSLPGGWIGAYAEGNNLGPGLAQYLSRALEAEAFWFGLAGRSLAFRVQRFKLGKRIDETTQPADLFAPEGPGLLPAYPDAEQEVFTRLHQAGIAEPYRFLHAEELGARPSGPPDAVQIRVGPDGSDEQPFAHRAPPADGLRSLFDRFDEEASIVEDDLVVRGAHDPDRGRALFATLRKIHSRRRPPSGWTFRFAVESPDGASLLDPLMAQYAEERKAGRAPFELVRGG
jgi:hypothetical protein